MRASRPSSPHSFHLIRPSPALTCRAAPPRLFCLLSISTCPDQSCCHRLLYPQEEGSQSKALVWAPISCLHQAEFCFFQINRTVSSKPNSLKSPVTGETNCCMFGHLCTGLPFCRNLQNKARSSSLWPRRAHPGWLLLSVQNQFLGNPWPGLVQEESARSRLQVDQTSPGSYSGPQAGKKRELTNH